MSERKKKIESALNKLFSTSKEKATAPDMYTSEATAEAPPSQTEIVQPKRRANPEKANTLIPSTSVAASQQSPASNLPTVGKEVLQTEEVAANGFDTKSATTLSGSSSIAAADRNPSTFQNALEASPQVSAVSTPASSDTKEMADNGPFKVEQDDMILGREAASTEKICQLVIFTLAGESFGLPIDRVESIIKLQAITVVPHARPYVVGVTNLRGTVLPVIDLRRRFRLAAAEQTEDQRIVVVLFNDEKIGLMVDSVTQVLRLPQAAIEPPPPIVTAFVHSAFVTGIAKVDERLVILLDLEKVLLPEHGN